MKRRSKRNKRTKSSGGMVLSLASLTSRRSHASQSKPASTCLPGSSPSTVIGSVHEFYEQVLNTIEEHWDRFHIDLLERSLAVDAAAIAALHGFGPETFDTSWVGRESRGRKLAEDLLRLLEAYRETAPHFRTEDAVEALLRGRWGLRSD